MKLCLSFALSCLVCQSSLAFFPQGSFPTSSQALAIGGSSARPSTARQEHNEALNEVSPKEPDSSESSLSNPPSRRQVLSALLATSTAAIFSFFDNKAEAQVFFDPAQYGDQELRVAAVDSLKESVRRSILQTPSLASSFYQLAILDALSYDAASNKYGPDGSIVGQVLSLKPDASDTYTLNLQKACLTLLEAEKKLKKLSAISIADAVALAGAGAIESIGGPVLTVQLGRADTAKNTPINPNMPLNLLSGALPSSQVVATFRQAGLTEREMTAIMTGLLTLETVEKTVDVNDWKASAKPKFREPGKMGRMSEFKRLTDEDIAEAEAQAALEADPEYEDPDDGWYIADSFGDRDSRFGQRIGKETISEKSFNRYLQTINDAVRSKNGSGNAAVQDLGWIAQLLINPDTPTTQQWVAKYASSNLSYLKDLNVAYNSMTQLGAVYTGGKYENLLKNKPRKSLNDDDLKLF